MDQDTYDLINSKKKFELSLAIVAGINYYGVGKLIFLDGIMNKFAYIQALYYFIKTISKK